VPVALRGIHASTDIFNSSVLLGWLPQVRTPLLILTIYTQWLDGSSHEYTFEMTKDDVDKVLTSFAKIAAEVRDASVY